MLYEDLPLAVGARTPGYTGLHKEATVGPDTVRERLCLVLDVMDEGMKLIRDSLQILTCSASYIDALNSQLIC